MKKTLNRALSGFSFVLTAAMTPLVNAAAGSEPEASSSVYGAAFFVLGGLFETAALRQIWKIFKSDSSPDLIAAIKHRLPASAFSVWSAVLAALGYWFTQGTTEGAVAGGLIWAMANLVIQDICLLAKAEKQRMIIQPELTEQFLIPSGGGIQGNINVETHTQGKFAAKYELYLVLKFFLLAGLGIIGHESGIRADPRQNYSIDIIKSLILPTVFGATLSPVEAYVTSLLPRPALRARI